MSAVAAHHSAAGPDSAESISIVRIGRNFSFRMVSQVLSALINVGAMVLLANHLSASRYGDYAYYFALIPLLASLSDLGIGVITTREIARHRAEGARLLGDALLVKGALAALFLVVGLPTIAIVADPTVAALLVIVVLAALLDFGQDPSIWTLRAHERLDLEALLLLVDQTARLGLLAAAVWLKAPLALFLGATLASYLIRVGIGAVIVSRTLYAPRIAPERARLRALVREGLPFCLAMFGVVLYGRVGVLMLKAFATSADVAYFNIGYMLAQPLGFISSALSMAAFPALSRRAHRGPEAVAEPMHHTTKYQLLVALPLSAGLVALAPRIVPLLFPAGDFVAAAGALRIISLALLFVFMNLMARYVLTALDRQREYLRAIVAGLVVNVALCALLIPRYGFMGAGIAWVAAEVVIFAICQVAFAPFLGFPAVARSFVRPFMAATGMGATVYLLRELPLPVLVVLGVAVYAGLLLLLRAFSPREIQLARGVYVQLRLPGFRRLARAEPGS